MEPITLSAPELDQLAREAVRKIREASVSGTRLHLIAADCDADDACTWWELLAVFEVPETASPVAGTWPRRSPVVTLGPGARTFGELRLMLFFPADLLSWDDRKYRDPVVAVGQAAARELRVPFYIPEVGSIAQWWQLEHQY